MKTLNYNLHNSKHTNKYSIEFTEGEYKGIIFSLGEVKFGENKEVATLSFHYDIESGKVTDIERFEKTVGDFLVELIESGIHKNDLVYTGGKDESREVNYREVDSE